MVLVEGRGLARAKLQELVEALDLLRVELGKQKVFLLLPDLFAYFGVLVLQPLLHLLVVRTSF